MTVWSRVEEKRILGIGAKLFFQEFDDAFVLFFTNTNRTNKDSATMNSSSYGFVISNMNFKVECPESGPEV